MKLVKFYTVFILLLSLINKVFCDEYYNAIIIIEQQNSDRNGVNWSEIEALNSQKTPMKNPNELLYNKNINDICSTCYFFDNNTIYTKLNAGILNYKIYPLFDAESNYQINAYVAIARCGEFYINQKYDLINKKLFQYKVNCGNNPDKSIITTIYLNKK